MSVIPVSLTTATLALLAVQLRRPTDAHRTASRQRKEHWMVFGVLAGGIAVSGALRENPSVSLAGFLLAVSGLLYRVPSVVDGMKAKRDEAKSLIDCAR